MSTYNNYGDATSNIGPSPRVGSGALYSAVIPQYAPPTATATPPLPHHHLSWWRESTRIPDFVLALAAAFIVSMMGEKKS